MVILPVEMVANHQPWWDRLLCPREESWLLTDTWLTLGLLAKCLGKKKS